MLFSSVVEGRKHLFFPYRKCGKKQKVNSQARPRLAWSCILCLTRGNRSGFLSFVKGSAIKKSGGKKKGGGGGRSANGERKRAVGHRRGPSPP